MYSENVISKINENTERKELLEWIPTLVKENLNSLTTKQLRMLHYILGYNCSEADNELLMESFEGNDYSEDVARNILKMFKREGFLIISEPY